MHIQSHPMFSSPKSRHYQSEDMKILHQRLIAEMGITRKHIIEQGTQEKHQNADKRNRKTSRFHH